MALWSGENAPRREEMVLGTVRTVPPAGFRVYQTEDSDRTNNNLVMEPHQSSSGCEMLNEGTISSV